MRCWRIATSHPTCPSGTTTSTPTTAGPAPGSSSARCAATFPTTCAGGAGPCSSTPSGRATAGASATWPTWPTSAGGPPRPVPRAAVLSPLHAPRPDLAPATQPVLPVEPAVAEPRPPLDRAGPGVRRGTARARPPAPEPRRRRSGPRPPTGSSTATRCGRSSGPPSSGCGRRASAGRPTRRSSGGARSVVAASSSTPSTPRCATTTNGRGASGRPRTATPRPSPSSASPPPTPTRCRSTPGCSGWSTGSSTRPGRPSRSWPTSPSASIPTAPTPGAGRTCTRRASASARPPTSSTPEGQDWGLPPFIPWALRAAHYEPFIEAVRATLRHAGGIRVDHVMGLFRLYWIAAGSGPEAGGYVRYRADELLAPRRHRERPRRRGRGG